VIVSGGSVTIRTGGAAVAGRAGWAVWAFAFDALMLAISRLRRAS
jgi:hypothetical protein